MIYKVSLFFESYSMVLCATIDCFPSLYWYPVASIRLPFLSYLKTYSFAAVRNIKDGLVTLDVKEKKDSEETREVVIAADTIVMSVGALPNEKLYEELAAEESGLEVYNIGDSAGIANVQSAIGMACRLVEELTRKGC